MDFSNYLQESAGSIWEKTLKEEQRKLRVIQDKLPKAISDNDFAKVASLATTAESIANRLAILSQQILKANSRDI
jgi:hypothetical protein